MPDIWMNVDAAIEVPVNKVPVVATADGFTIDETIAFNEGGMDLNWNFTQTDGTVTQTNVVPTAAGDYDWAHVGNGMYKIEMTAIGGASANNDTEGFGWFSGKADAICPFSGPIIGFRAAALNNALVDGGDNLDVNVVEWLGQACAAVTVNGVPEVDVTYWRGGAVPAVTTAGVPEVDVTFWAGNNPTTVSGGLPDVNIETIDNIDFGATMKAS
ncbi:unnamed protein product, partial [marine sediment metagenome]